MIKDIKEINLPKYATLSAATVTLSDMGQKSITAQIKIDGGIVPDFSFDWILEFQGERYIHTVRNPQGAKDNTSRYATIDLTFKHWVEHELSRYYFVEITSLESGTAIADKYIASLSLTLGDFITAFNNVLDFYYHGRIVADLNPRWAYALEPKTIEISYTFIWDLLLKIYETYNIRWEMVSDPADKEKCVIRFGYPTTEMDHIFEYGFNGGLLKVERQVQDSDIRNILLGRGGEKNLPYRYFKDVNPDIPDFKADPDWIPELANIYFSELRDASFRSYVQGWKAKHYNGNTRKDDAYVPWAWEKGYTDERFDPVEIVKDESSIAKYGELWGGLEANEQIYPSIQGITVPEYGRVDQIVDVEEIESDDTNDTEESDATEIYLDKDNDPSHEYAVVIMRDVPKYQYVTAEVEIPWEFDIPAGKHGNLYVDSIYCRGFNGRVSSSDLVIPNLQTARLTVHNMATGEKLPNVDIPEGRYKANYTIEIQNSSTYKLNISLTVVRLKLTTSSINDDVTNTFNVWVKNIWGTTKQAGESDVAYAERVWRPILGDRSGNTAKLIFSTGLLSISEDYEFDIAKLSKNPQYDPTKTLIERDKDGNIVGTFNSEWKISLIKSDAELDATGLMIPNTRINAKAGDYFFFSGIDMPHQYVIWAEQRLYDYKKDQLATVADIKPTWVVSLDKVRMCNQMPNESSTLLSQLVLGGSIRLADARFVPGDAPYEILYVQSITYKYNEPSSKEASIIPDVEIVLSDQYQINANPISILQGEVSALSKQVGAISNIEQVVRNVGDSIYLFKDGRSEVSHSPTRFEKRLILQKGLESHNFSTDKQGFQIDGLGNAELLSVVVRDLLRSPSFIDGLLGAGWRLGMDKAGVSHLAVDRLIVRQTMRVLELLVEKVRSVGGQIIVSAASGKVASVDMDATSQRYLLTFETECQFIAGDLVRCAVMNGDVQKSYWVEIAAVDRGVVAIPVSEFDDALPAVGDECVLMGNTTDAQRQGLISISATDDGVPRVDVLNGVSGKTLAGCLHARLGSLDGIADSWFPVDDQPHGYGLYADNAFLRGRFLLTTGEDVKAKFEIVEGRIMSAVTALRNDFATEKGYLSNPSFEDGLTKWETDGPTISPRGIEGNDLLLPSRRPVVVTEDDGRKVALIRNSYILQKHENLKSIPSIPENDSGQKEAVPIFLSFFYRCAKTGKLHVTFKNVDKTGFSDFNSMEVEEELSTTDSYVQYTCNGLWNGTGDFELSFTGDIYLYMLILSTDKVESLIHRYRTLFDQSERLVKISAAVFDKDENMIKETGLMVKPEGAGIYAQDADGKLALIGVSVDETDADGNKISVVKLTGDHIKLEGLVTANENFKILEDGSIETKNGKFTGVIDAKAGKIGGFSIASGHIGIDKNGGDNGMFLYDNIIGFNGDDMQAFIGCYNDLGIDILGRFVNTQSSYLPNYGLVFNVNNSLSNRNYAFTGTGDGILNGVIEGFRLNSIDFSQAGEAKYIDFNRGKYVEICCDYSNCALILPRLADLRLSLGLNATATDNIAVHLTVVKRSGQETKIYGRTKSITVNGNSIDDDQHPYLRDNNFNNQGYWNITNGDVIEFLLTYSNLEYNAYTVSIQR